LNEIFLIFRLDNLFRSAIYANRLYLEFYKKTQPKKLAKNSEGTPKIIGNVTIHPTATVDPSAVLGPNVSVGPGVTIGPGVRIRESIVLGNSVIQNHSCVLHSIIGWNSMIGSWVRVEGTPSDPDPNKPYAKIEHQSLFTKGKFNPSITIIGESFRINMKYFFSF
jgi:mannose-1-phosphate guanylyltransferase